MPQGTVPGSEEQVVDDTTTLDPAVADDTTRATEEPTPDTGQTEPPDDEPVDGILTDEEFEALKDDPVKLRQELVSAYTKKTQKVAGLMRFAEAFERDPQGAVRRLAAGVGVAIPDGAGSRTPTEQAADAKTFRDEIAAVMGEEVADKLTPIFQRMAQAATEPYARRQETLESQAALTQAEAVLDTFTAKYPDWKKHEKAMVELSKQIQPTRGTDPVKWMEMLHTLVTNGAGAADRAQSIIDRIQTSVRGSESRRTGTQGSRVAQTPPSLPTFEQAWSAGVRGKRFEH